MPKVKDKLSKKSRELLENFDEAAQDYGWERDQGSFGAAARSQKEYEEKKENLEKYISRLEKRNKFLSKKLTGGKII